MAPRQASAGKGTLIPLLLTSAFAATQADGLKLTHSVNNSKPQTGQVLTLQRWFTINPARVS